MSVRFPIPLILVVLSIGSIGVKASAEVTLLQLDAARLSARFPNHRDFGINAGDVLLSNDRIAVVVRTAEDSSPDKKDDGRRSTRIGGCILLDAVDGIARSIDAREVVTVLPGPTGIWRKAEAARATHAVVLRFRRREQDWEAELSYRLERNSDSIAIVTTIRNRHDSRTLQAPIVDAWLANDARVQGEGTTVRLDRERAGTSLTLRTGRETVAVRERDDHEWLLGFVSGDPRRSLLTRVTKRIGRFGRGRSFEPLNADADHDRALQDRDDWFRIAPGKERTVRRTLTFGVAGWKADPLAEIRTEDDSPTSASARSKRSSATTFGGAGARIIGRLRSGPEANRAGPKQAKIGASDRSPATASSAARGITIVPSKNTPKSGVGTTPIRLTPSAGAAGSSKDELALPARSAPLLLPPVLLPAEGARAETSAADAPRAAAKSLPAVVSVPDKKPAPDADTTDLPSVILEIEDLPPPVE